ncbi:GspH/FimT family pseudopilin [Colwellia sp. TT2012]|uniref:GspH/FimT family pseudopilin n=1 Tax=Colwellia sp. TT2012 TaxID=1720342 RepID=UPI00070E941D|nr:GspH/FimT family pseudopilin [Colwellia sp. TT2012]
MFYVTLIKFNNQKLPPSILSLKLQKGITLVELMMSLAITSILAVISLPNFNEFTVQMRVDNEISMLQRLLLTARNSAINSGEKVIMCPLTEGGQCTTNWHEVLSVFIDKNNNKTYDAANNERIVVTKAAIKLGDQLIYGKGRTMVTYRPSGHLTGLSNGTFRYCPLGHEVKSRGIVIARSGRFYVTSDIDNDSKDETRMNKEITCN